MQLEFSMGFTKSIGRAKFHPNLLRNLRETNAEDKISFTQKTLTFHGGQGHSNRYQNMELYGLCHHIKFEGNQSVHF